MATLVQYGVEQERVPVVPAKRQVRGSLALDFESDVQTGATRLAASVQEPPLRIVRPFLLEDGAALVHLHNVSGGLLGGDFLQLSVNVGPRACVQLTSTGATRVYRPKENSAACVQVNRFKICEDGLLEYVPDAIIPFAKSRFRQQTTIYMEPGGGLFWWEILAPGRLAHGEEFEYEYVELKTDLMAAGQIIASENVHLQPHCRNLSSLTRLGPYRYWTTFYIVRVGPDSGFWLDAEQKLRKVLHELHPSDEARWGVSTLPAHGLAVRGLAQRGCYLLANLRTIWTEAKLLLYGRAAIPPRKVN